MSFRWRPDEKPPQIEAHSKAKLRVLRRYLRAYFDRLNVNPHREEFKLDLVDGFAGGGLFSDGNDLVPGSPMVMLEEAEEAKDLPKQLEKMEASPYQAAGRRLSILFRGSRKGPH